MLNKLFRVSLITLIVSGLLFIVLTACALWGIAHLSYDDGFGVDSQENVYLGTNRCIDVFFENRLVRQIKPPTSRGYRFIVTPEDTLELTTGDKLYTLDLYGTIIANSELDAAEIMQEPVTKCEQAGATYLLSHTAGRMTVVRELQTSREIIFHEPISHVLFRTAFALISVCFNLSILVFVGVSRYQTHIHRR